jgi:hypothetical protein
MLLCVVRSSQKGGSYTELRLDPCCVSDTIQNDQKVSVHLMIQYRKLQVMFKVYPAILQTFIDTPNCVLEGRVQYSTVHILSVFCCGHLQIINCVGIVILH